MQHFVDEAIIKVRSGKGGPGCVSFRREKFIPFGGPNGGDGGDGGSVIFQTKENLRTLYQLKLKRNFFAKNGQPGMGWQKSGKKGADIIIEVPPGTLVIDQETGELLKDLTFNDETFTLLKGGKGGLGNCHFATSTNQAPRYAQPGLPGKELTLKIELKLIADVGLVGFPNAGKSTLLSVLTKAQPKIANYPFTTLIPNLGVFTIADESFVMADIPGIIEGASNGVGLGIDFLKHIERTKMLLYIIDPEDSDFEQQYEKLKNELHTFSDKLINKPFLIAVSKMDLEDSETAVELLKEHLKQPVLTYSAVTHQGLKELLYKLKSIINRIENEQTQ
ncbi:MAG: GTPase ObgE [Spirochaetes bacterium]|nr:GTPase ObgE [Spirochaetota bacterium]